MKINTDIQSLKWFNNETVSNIINIIIDSWINGNKKYAINLFNDAEISFMALREDWDNKKELNKFSDYYHKHY